MKFDIGTVLGLIGIIWFVLGIFAEAFCCYNDVENDLIEEEMLTDADYFIEKHEVMLEHKRQHLSRSPIHNLVTTLVMAFFMPLAVFLAIFIIIDKKAYSKSVWGLKFF